MNKRQEKNPEFFRKDFINLGPSFTDMIDENYLEFLDNRNGFQFPPDMIPEENVGNNILFIYIPLLVKAKCWVPVTINLVQRKIIVNDCAHPSIAEKTAKKKLCALTVMLPYFIKYIRGEMEDLAPFQMTINTTLPKVS